MSIDSDVIRGHVDTIILKTLTTGEKYGYEIIKEIEQKSKGTYELKQPTLYSCLKRLEGQGLISAFWKNSDIGGKRHYYKLTKKGRETYDNSMQAWFNSRSIIDSLMGTKPTELTFAEENEEIVPDKSLDVIVEDEIPSPETIQEVQEIKDSAQLVLDESSCITQENEPTEARDFSIENLDEDDVALLGDYYKTDENQINLFAVDADAVEPSYNNNEDESIDTSFEPATESLEMPDNKIVDKIDEPSSDEEVFKNYDGTDLSKYRQNNKDNYFEKISYGIVDENNIDITIDEPEESLQDEEINDAPQPDFSSFNFFTNYPNDNEEENEPVTLTTLDEDEEENYNDRLHFGFGSSDEDEEEGFPEQFDNLDELENSDDNSSDIHPTITLYGDSDENDVVDYSSHEGMEMDYQSDFVSSDLKPYNIGHYTEPEYKEKLNQLTAYTKSSYETKPVNSTFDYAPTESRSITDFKDELQHDGIEVRSYSRPEKEPLKDKKYLLVNKIKFATSWIVFAIMSLLIGATYLIANSVGYTDLSLVPTAMPASTFFILAWIVVLIVPAVYTVIFLLNRTKKVKPNYNAVVSLVFALLFFIVCLNIIYTLNILNGFTKFSQIDYNHLLWLLPAVDSLLIVFQSLIYSLLFKTKRFNA